VLVRYPQTARTPEAAVGQTVTVFCNKETDGWRLADTFCSLWRIDEASAVSSPNARACRQRTGIEMPIEAFDDAISPE
jgi:hypothetical protein